MSESDRFANGATKDIREMKMPNRSRWTQLSPLLDEMLGLDQRSRDRRLAELRTSDELLAADLAALLRSAGSAAASRFMSVNAGEPEEAASLVGKRIGAYVIDARLGEGAAGSVWRARRADGRFEGWVAVKLLHLSLVGSAGAQRFEREGAILARLSHPNIAQLLDAGVTSNGQPYLVLELVEGTRIDLYCDERRLDVEQRVTLFGHVLEAVTLAHMHLVVHRDIKPNNILITNDGRVKLLDFGIAKLLQEGAETTSITADGQRVMTPHYAAPEQLQGSPITTSTDVYALGVLLFRLLAGRHPTAADDATSVEVMRTTLEVNPMRLGAALAERGGGAFEDLQKIATARHTTLSRLQRDLRGDLENIVGHALRKNPAERYQTVESLAEDLRRHLAHEPVRARPDSLAYRCAKFVRRHRSSVAATVVVLLTVAAGMVGTFTQAQRAARERDNALRQLGYAESSNELINFLLQEGSEKPFTTPVLLDRAERLVDLQFAEDGDQRAHLLLILADMYGQATKPKKAEALLLRAQVAARDTPDMSLKIAIECQLAIQHADNGEFDLARKIFDSAIETLNGESVTDRSVLARCLFDRGQALGLMKDERGALADMQLAIKTLGAPRLDQRSLAVQMRAGLAMVHSRIDQAASAEREFLGAIAGLEAMGRGNTTLARALYNDLGSLLMQAGQTLRAAEAYRRAMTVAPTLDPNPALEGNYARVLIELGHPRNAMQLIDHALAVNTLGGSQRRGVMIPLMGALAWCETLDFERCDAMLETARAGLNKFVPPGRSVFGALEMQRGQAAVARGDQVAARAILKRATTLYDSATDKSHYSIRARTLLSRTELMLGDKQAALTSAARAVAQARESMSGFAHSAWLGSALVALGLAQQASGQLTEASESLRAALNELELTLGESAPATVEARRLVAAQ